MIVPHFTRSFHSLLFPAGRCGSVRHVCAVHGAFANGPQNALRINLPTIRAHFSAAAAALSHSRIAKQKVIRYDGGAHKISHV